MDAHGLRLGFVKVALTLNQPEGWMDAHVLRLGIVHLRENSSAGPFFWARPASGAIT
jgi:hypothetical protein